MTCFIPNVHKRLQARTLEEHTPIQEPEKIVDFSKLTILGYIYQYNCDILLRIFVFCLVRIVFDYILFCFICVAFCGTVIQWAPPYCRLRKGRHYLYNPYRFGNSSDYNIIVSHIFQ